MKITMFCDVVVENNGQPTQMAGCGIILVGEEKNQTRKRFLSFGLGGSDIELANIQVVRLALASVLPPFRRNPVFLHFTERNALDQICQDKSENYPHQFAEMRRWYSYYNNISLILDTSDDENLVQANKLASIACKTQKNTDSNILIGS